MQTVGVTTKPIDELNAWLALCEVLGIAVVDRGCGEYELAVPPGVAVPDAPGHRASVLRGRTM